MANPTLVLEVVDGDVVADWNLVNNATNHKLRRAPFGSSNWITVVEKSGTIFTDTNVEPGQKYSYYVKAFDRRGNLLGQSTTKSIMVPVTLPAPPGVVAVGYAAAAGTTGGTGGNVILVDSDDSAGAYTALKNALMVSGKRIIKITGSEVINGGGETLKVQNGDMTLDGSGYSASIKRLQLVLQASNIIITNMRLRPGDLVDAPDDVDALTINTTDVAGINRFVIDHCSLLWGPDVTLAILNQVSDVTVQYCMLGAGLRRSAHSEAGDADPGHSYGPNVSTIDSQDPNVIYPKRISFYRNYIFHNYTGRNIRGIWALYVEYVDNVVYNWGRHLAHIYPRKGDYAANMFKKGPGTPSSNVVVTNQEKGTPIAGSTYFPLVATDPRRNLGIGFTPTANVVASGMRTTAHAGPGGLIAAGLLLPATSALANEIVAAAGPAVVDDIDQDLKDDWTNDTGSYFNGDGLPAPNPSWPAG